MMSKLIVITIIVLHSIILISCQQNSNNINVNTSLQSHGTVVQPYNFTNSLNNFKIMMEEQLLKVNNEISITYHKIKNTYNLDFSETNEVEGTIIIILILFLCDVLKC